ncbi:DUF4376 domain-containing protein [Leptospira santarosai]|uniref:DUF4376 domain-containing protein n=1 Tax=Leptospira santarosai TaxID=28183 RepID=UPI0002BDEFE4|nr:hypothetical protein [Leptospira santarosai]ASV10745.1 hypothetical protein B2G51_01930 [Leptospira santarosai]EMP81463.1 hypothetical protein LEP1GSC162_0759 [Leptospira santarosai str. CBC1531]MDO6384514.1 hypothetical protein [Leptospira santarosai]
MSNYIIDKHSNIVIWINVDPSQLTGRLAWGEFDLDKHDIVYSLHYNPQIGEKFRAKIVDGIAQNFEPRKVYNKITRVERVLFNWDEVLDPETETDIEPLKDEKSSLLPHQVFTETDGWIVDLIQKKDSLIKQINSICESKITAGFASTALGALHFYSSDRDDQLNLVGLVSLNASVLYKCTDKNGIKEYRNHTADQIKQVLNDGAIRKTLLLKNCASLKAMIQAVGADSKLDEIDITSGWD